MRRDYLTAEEFDLMFEDELDALDLDYDYEKWLMEKSAMEEDYSFAV